MIFRLLSYQAGEGSTGAGGGAGAGAGGGTGAGAGAGGAGGGQGGAGGAGAGAGGAAAKPAAGADGGAGAGAAAKPPAGAGSFAGDLVGGQGEGGEGAAGAGKPAAGADGAAYELTLPEGTIDADKPLIQEFGTFAQKAKLSKEAAQSVLDWWSAKQRDQAKASVEAFQREQTENQKALESHPQLGGAKLPETKAHAKAAVTTLDKLSQGLGTRFVKFAHEAGYGSSPVVVELLATIGKALAEDSTGATGGAGGGAELTREQKLERRYAKTVEQLKQREK